MFQQEGMWSRNTHFCPASFYHAEHFYFKLSSSKPSLTVISFEIIFSRSLELLWGSLSKNSRIVSTCISLPVSTRLVWTINNVILVSFWLRDVLILLSKNIFHGFNLNLVILNCLWTENCFCFGLEFTIKNTRFQSLRSPGLKLTILQAFKVVLFYPQNGQGNGSSLI